MKFISYLYVFFFFFFNDTATTEIYTLSLHDALPISRFGMALLSAPPEPWSNRLGPFSVSTPALDHFPFGVWSRLVIRHSRQPANELLAYSDSTGHPPFREAIAEYVGTGRGVRCDPSQVMVVTGSQQALEISARVLLDPRDAVWIEEPSYPGARQ